MLIVGNLGRQKFKCYCAVQTRVLCFVDHTHAIPTELFEDAVVRNGLPNHGWSATVWRDVRGDVEGESTNV